MSQDIDTQPAQPDWTPVSDPIEFPAGLPGFEDHKRFVLESRSDMRPFLSLRSLVDPEVALPMIDCQLLIQKSRPEVTDDVARLMGSEAANDVRTYFILKVDPGTGTISANTRAPVLIAARKAQGFQIFLDHEDLKVDEPLINLVPPADGG